jgi:hypothetical protein
MTPAQIAFSVALAATLAVVVVAVRYFLHLPAGLHGADRMRTYRRNAMPNKKVGLAFLAVLLIVAAAWVAIAAGYMILSPPR